MIKFQKIFSKTISILFHPLLMPSYALLIVFNSGTYYSFIPFQAQKIIYLLVFLSTFLIPISLIPFLINLKLISNIHMNERKDRIIPLFITSLSYFFAYYLLNRLPFHVPEFIMILVIASAILILLNLLFAFKWKISIHLVGISGLLAFIFSYSIVYYANLLNILIILAMLSGIVGFARLYLKAHTPVQVYAGFFIGFVGMLLLIYINLYI